MTEPKMSDTKIELLPCPFCGGNAEPDTDDLGCHSVRCMECTIVLGAYSTARSAARSWNRRPVNRPVSGEVAEAREIARLLNEHNTAGVIRAYVGDTTADAYEKAIALLQSLSVGGGADNEVKCEACHDTKVNPLWSAGERFADKDCPMCKPAAPSQAREADYVRVSPAEKAAIAEAARESANSGKCVCGHAKRSDMDRCLNCIECGYNAPPKATSRVSDETLRDFIEGYPVGSSTHDMAMELMQRRAAPPPTAQARAALQHVERDAMLNEGGTISHEALCKVRDALSRMPADGGGWRAIETGPKDGRAVLLNLSGSARVYTGEYVTCGETGWWRDTHGHRRSPTHWQPLPAPPKAGAR